MAVGNLLLVLHCHLPYVRHPEHEEFLEEDWFYEAVAETYVPLLLVFRRLAADGVPFRVTLSLSPTLCEMLANDLLQCRLDRYLARHIELAEKETERTRGTAFEDAARMYFTHYRQVRSVWSDDCGRDLPAAFRGLADAGHLELIGSAATHALLPVLAETRSQRAQLAAGLQAFERHFGSRPLGLWLPECGYAPGVDKLLAEFGLRFFFAETHAALLAEPRPPFGVFAPIATPAGPLAFARDVESSRQVWSADQGYPGDHWYREFHRDLGYDADLDYIRPYLHADGRRMPLGLKYCRVTGDVPLGDKQPYEPARAAERARAHARHFVTQRLDQVRRLERAVDCDPVIVCPYDAELFGHWWFEGPQFLDAVFRAAASVPELQWALPARIACGDDGRIGRQAAQLPLSSWGDGGYLDVWVNASNDWIYRDLHGAERTMAALAAAHPVAQGLLLRALNQACRELLLAQSSDWPFLIYTGGARDYAESRFRALMERFGDLAEQIRTGDLVEERIADCEWRDDPFPWLDYRIFRA